MNSGKTNLDIAKLFRNVAAAISIKSPNNPASRFRIIAYRNAADSIEHLTSEVKDLYDEGKLGEIPGVGKGISANLEEIFKTGKVNDFEEIFKGLSPAIFVFMDIPGIGAKRASILASELGINKAHGALEKLTHAAKKGHIRDIEGFGEEIEKDILENIPHAKERSTRKLLFFAENVAEELIDYLKVNKFVEKAYPLGSLRRMMSSVGDIDIAVASKDSKNVIDYFVKYPKVQKIIEKGEISASILLPGNVQVDLMVLDKSQFGSLLQHFTGSKNHNIALRTFALKKGLSLSEKGITPKGEILRNYSREEDFYNALGLNWIPPELREDKGEIQAAQKDRLPTLVESTQIKGDLHMHSNLLPVTSHDSGAHTPIEMLEIGDELGYEYMGFTEHNPKQTESERSVLNILERKRNAILKLNENLSKYKNIKKIYNGLEIDITPSGKLALPESAFDTLDYAIASLHSSFRGSRVDQTKRVIEGISHPKVRIFGHPTARLLNKREGVELNWEKIFEFCLSHNKWIEINSSPDRLDLPDTLVLEAVKKGVRLVINTDSHDKDWLRGMIWGVTVARRGWAEKKDIVNCLPIVKFDILLKVA